MFPLANLERIILMGNVEISPFLIGILVKYNVELCWLTLDGRFKARLCGRESKNIYIRLNQYEKSKDQQFVLNFAREIVRGKVKNYGRMIQKKHNISYSLFEGRLKNMLKSLESASDLDIIRGLEGSFSALYYRYFPSMLKNDLGFKKRLKHPPPDPVNILLSFGYTMLFNCVFSFVQAAGLEPYLGILHQPKYGHPALVSDLIEQFRAPVVDNLVITLINTSRISEKDFELQETIKFKKEGIGKFVDAWKQKINKKIEYNNMKYSYLQIFQSQVHKYARYLEGKTEHYRSYEAR